jgi:hypothetical protein
LAGKSKGNDYLVDQGKDKKGSIKRVKCRAIPVQSGTGPEGSSKLRLPDFKTHGT